MTVESTMGAPSAEDPRSVALHVLVDGGSRQGTIDIIGHLASANGASVETIRGDRGEALALWLTFKAGWFDGAPLHLDVVASTPNLAAQGRRRLSEQADAVIFVADTSPKGVDAAARHLRTGNPGTGGDQRLVMFCHRAVDGGSDLAPEAVLEALGQPATTPALVTSGQGAGIRYGFALAVRLALNERRTRTTEDLRAKAPLDAPSILAMVREESPAGPPATEISPAEPSPAAPPATVPAPTPTAPQAAGPGPDEQHPGGTGADQSDASTAARPNTGPPRQRPEVDERRLRASTPVRPLPPLDAAPTPEAPTPNEAPAPEAPTADDATDPIDPSHPYTGHEPRLWSQNTPDAGPVRLPPSLPSPIPDGHRDPRPGDLADEGEAPPFVPDVRRSAARQNRRTPLLIVAAGLVVLVVLLVLLTFVI